MRGKMDVLCACDERYVPHTATMLCSLLEFNANSKIHILHDSAAGSELLKLKSFAQENGSEVTLYPMSPDHFHDLRVDWLSPAAYYRLLAVRVLPQALTKVLYLNSDIIVRRSLAKLWDTDLDGYGLAAVKDLAQPLGVTKFNSGVMLLNLDYWRRNKVGEQAIAFARDNPEKVVLHDQDALNAILVDRWVQLAATWNYQLYQSESGMRPLLDAAIVHYSGFVKPWHWSWNFVVPHPLKYEYHRYRKRTPWRRYALREGRRVLPWRAGFVRVAMKIVLPRSIRHRIVSVRMRLIR